MIHSSEFLRKLNSIDSLKASTLLIIDTGTFTDQCDVAEIHTGRRLKK